MPEGAKSQRAALWILSVLLAALFLLAGAAKLSGATNAVQGFAHLGYPDWFRLLIGVIEVGGAVTLLVPWLAYYSATGLGVVMIGAAYSHVTVGETAQALLPLACLAALGFIGYARGRAG